MDVTYINPFITSSRQVFQTMVHLDLTLGKPYIKRSNESRNVVSAVININGCIEGMVLLGFSQSVAVAVASGLSGQTLKSLDSDCLDALGEIANMIVGNAKKDIPSSPPLNMSTPKIIVGSNNIPYPKGETFIVLPCDTPVGGFFIEVCLKKAIAKAA
jgi:chemotaxis protein CheX